MNGSFNESHRRRGFTLVELLVVILIILLVSAVVLPTVLFSFENRKISETARIVQAALVQARDRAVHANAPRGIRLLPDPSFAGDLSYLGTYAADRQDALLRLFMRPATERPGMRFVIGGAQYPKEFPWAPNVYFVRHLPPECHAAFFASSIPIGAP